MQGGASGAPLAPVGPPLVVAPRRPAAARYAAPASLELRSSLPPDPLRDALVQSVVARARALGRSVPVADDRLHAVAQDVAESLQGESTPAPENLEFLSQYYGLIEMAPRLSLVRATGTSDADVVQVLTNLVDEVLRSADVAVIGAGVHRSGDELAATVAYQERRVELAVLPRRMEPGARVRIEGRLLGAYRQPELIVTVPDGTVRTHAAAIDSGAARLRGEVVCDRGPGVYQVEVGATDRLGPGIAANFPLFCGVSPPAVPPAAVATAHVGAWSVAESEQRVLQLVNRDRVAAGLKPLVLDAALSNVARAHSRDMAEHDFVGHISPTTGDPEARVRRAGFNPRFLAENAGLSFSPEQAHADLMKSPGHRANVLHPHPTRIGIGVVWKKASNGQDVILVTELFM